MKIKYAVDFVFTPQRLEKLAFNSVDINEFIMPLTKTDYIFIPEFEENMVSKNFVYPIYRISFIELVELKRSISIWKVLRMKETKRKNK